MKGFLVVMAPILLCVVIYLSYTNSFQKKEIARLSTALNANTHRFVNPVFRQTTVKDFREGVLLFAKTRCDLRASGTFTGGSDTGNTRSVWFPLDTINSFIAYIENYSDSARVEHRQLGIRFYYAIDNGKNAATAGRHMLYMVPTMQVEGQPIDFDPYRTYKNGKGPVFLKDLLGNSSNADSCIPAMDHGTLCPINCPPHSNYEF